MEMETVSAPFIISTPIIQYLPGRPADTLSPPNRLSFLPEENPTPAMILPLIESVILGLVQGATEFIPVSSSAHLIVVPWLFGWEDPALTGLPFDVALHLGTLAAVLVFFSRDWLRLLRAFLLSVRERRIGADPDRRLAWLLLLGTIPGVLAGAFFEGAIDDLFHAPGAPVAPAAMLVLAMILAGFGLILLLADRIATHLRSLGKLTLWQAVGIGLAQALAVFPGVSRSGSTIAAGLSLGLRRDDAARFSFLLSAPIIAGAGAKSTLDIVSNFHSGALSAGQLPLFPAGFLAAAASGYFCIRFLMDYLQKHRIDLFTYYRWGLAVVIAVVAVARL
jgi:undecaprenyl-diphosphatase